MYLPYNQEHIEQGKSEKQNFHTQCFQKSKKSFIMNYIAIYVLL